MMFIVIKRYRLFLFLLFIFFIWRTGLFFISYLGGRLLSFNPSFPYSDVYLVNSQLPQWLWSFANFDGVHYLTIALYDYSAQFTQVYFPFYPLILGFLHKIFFSISPVFLGVVLSSTFFLLTLVTFYKLLEIDYKKSEIYWIILYLVFFPLSFFFGAVYSESLFLFFTLSAFISARKKRWLWAGIYGGLASATRFIGIFLLPALLWEWQHENLKSQISNLKSTTQKAKIKITTKNSKISNLYSLILNFTFSILHSPILYIAPLGLIAYLVYLQINFGDALYFWHAQPVFGAERSGGTIILLPQVFWRYWKIIITVNWFEFKFWVALLELSATLFSIFLLIAAHIRKVRPSYLIFSWLAVLLPTLTGTFSSMPRYILVAFPIYIVLGLIQSKMVKSAVLLIFIVLLTILTVYFTSGYFVS